MSAEVSTTSPGWSGSKIFSATRPTALIGRQTLYLERARHQVAELRRRAQEVDAKRVLVVVAAAHLGGLRRAFRETAAVAAASKPASAGVSVR